MMMAMDYVIRFALLAMGGILVLFTIPLQFCTFLDQGIG